MVFGFFKSKYGKLETENNLTRFLVRMTKILKCYIFLITKHTCFQKHFYIHLLHKKVSFSSFQILLNICDVING